MGGRTLAALNEGREHGAPGDESSIPAVSRQMRQRLLDGGDRLYVIRQKPVFPVSCHVGVALVVC